MKYQDFLEQKKINSESYGFEITPTQLDWCLYGLFDYQTAIVCWALRRGRAAIFADTGLGKTAMQLAWAHQVSLHLGLPVIILAPLAVAHQTVNEGKKFDIESKYASSQDDIDGPGIYVTNYEKLHKFDCSVFGGVVLDESSILKGMNGKVRKQVTEAFSKTPYRLSCTATPSPNDHMELGTQAEFLGIMSQLEMLAQYFVHDGSDTSKWRLKGHGVKRFWEWVSTWAVVIRKPSDLGFQDDGHELPELILHQHTVECAASDELFVTPAQSLSERISARRDSLNDRVQLAAKIAGEYPDQPILVWCNLNDESEMLGNLIDCSVEVKGADKDQHKVNAIEWFMGSHDVELIGKKLICGSQNTQKTEGRNTRKTRNTGRSEKNSLAEENLEKNTCKNTQKKTPKNSEEHQSSKSNTTREEEKNTHQIKNIESKPYQSHASTKIETLKSDLLTGSSNTESLHQITEKCDKSSQVDAQFVGRLTLDAARKKGCTSTIAMKPGGSEGFFAQTATLDLASSKTASNFSNRQLNTSKRVLISKPSIFGFGVNLQICNRMIFVGLSDSWEQYYQAIRRCWRYGQTKPVHVHIVSAETEGAVVENIRRKDIQHDEMAAQMVGFMREFMQREVLQSTTQKTEYQPEQPIQLPTFLRSA